MTSKSGGRIAPDGRSPAPKGQGKRARRHDLERPKTPGLHGSDLQQGDVTAMEQGQQVAPLRKQNQGAAQNRQRRQSAQPGNQLRQDGSTAPDPIAFLGDRLGGTRVAGEQSARATTDTNAMMPLLQKLATATGASGMISQAYITALANDGKDRGLVRTPLISMQDVERDLAEFLDGA